MKRKWIYGLCILSLALLSACHTKQDDTKDKKAKDSRPKVQTESVNSDKEPVTREIFAMDTYMTLTAYGENAMVGLDAAEKEIKWLDENLSTGIESSEIAKVNANHGGKVGEVASYLIQRSLELHKSTDGVFDISIYPVMKLWGFAGGDFKVPEENTLAETLKLVDAKKVLLDSENGMVSFDMEGMEIDLGAIAKGYTSNRVMEVLKENGVESAIVNLGGNVQVLGSKVDKSAWRVAIQDPVNAEAFLGILSTEDKAVITSGGYERYFEENGKKYHHIIDVKTGYPADSGLTSVSIVAKDGTLADGLSTSLFIMGEEKAKNYWREHRKEFEAILYKEDGSVYITEGLEGNFESEHPLYVIK